MSMFEAWVWCPAGMGSMPWTIASEIFPGWARSTATSITTAVNIGTNMVLMLSFLSLTETIFAFGELFLVSRCSLLPLNTSQRTLLSSILILS